jgi:hypothetical protein
MKSLIAVGLTISLLSACSGTFATGGPSGARIEIRGAKDLRTLVDGDAAALERVDRLEGRERMGTIFVYAELGTLAGCILLPRADDYSLGAATWSGIGLCAATLVLGIAAIIVVPSKHAYGEPLRLYNHSHPETPWLAPSLGVQ